MKQLKTIYVVATFMGCALFTGCNDDYLQKYPEDSLNEEAFFKTVTDLETYTNGFYGMFGASYDDLFSDNIGHGTGDYTFSQKLKGRIDETKIGSFGWKKDGVWENIHDINFMLVNAHKVEGDELRIMGLLLGILLQLRQMMKKHYTKLRIHVRWSLTR